MKSRKLVGLELRSALKAQEQLKKKLAQEIRILDELETQAAEERVQAVVDCEREYEAVYERNKLQYNKAIAAFQEMLQENGLEGELEEQAEILTDTAFSNRLTDDVKSQIISLSDRLQKLINEVLETQSKVDSCDKRLQVIRQMKQESLISLGDAQAQLNSLRSEKKLQAIQPIPIDGSGAIKAVRQSRGEAVFSEMSLEEPSKEERDELVQSLERAIESEMNEAVKAVRGAQFRSHREVELHESAEEEGEFQVQNPMRQAANPFRVRWIQDATAIRAELRETSQIVQTVRPEGNENNQFVRRSLLQQVGPGGQGNPGGLGRLG